MKGYIGKTVETLSKFKIYVGDGKSDLTTITINPGMRATVTDVSILRNLVTLQVEFNIGNQSVIAWLNLDDIKII